MPFNLPSNFCANPDSFLRKSRTSEVIDTPPAPAPPRYNWVASGEAVGTPENLIRTLYPSSSHTIASTAELETTTTPEDCTVIGKHSSVTKSKTPIVPGSFNLTTPLVEMSTSTHDEIINTLQSKIAKLEKEKVEWETRAQLAMVDRDRIDTLERSFAQLSLYRGLNTPRSSGSNNPFLAYRENTTTPTPAGPSGPQRVDTEIAQPLVPDDRSPSQFVQASPPPASHNAFLRPIHEETRTVSFSNVEVPRAERRGVTSRTQEPPKKVYACDLKLLEVPKFTGPSESPASLFNWRRLIKQFFTLKNVTDNHQRFIILGSVMVEPRAGAWYVNSRAELEGMSWESIMHELAAKTLPTGWLEDTERSIRQL